MTILLWITIIVLVLMLLERRTHDRPSPLYPELYAAAYQLYSAGRWTLDGMDELEQDRMWSNLRDAMGFEPGHATKNGFHDKPIVIKVKWEDDEAFQAGLKAMGIKMDDDNG